MYKIYKYVIPCSRLGITHVFQIPKDAWVLNTILQDNLAELYFVVNTDQIEIEQRKFVVYGTEQEITLPICDLVYVGTVPSVATNDTTIGHIFEIDPRK